MILGNVLDKQIQGSNDVKKSFPTKFNMKDTVAFNKDQELDLHID